MIWNMNKFIKDHKHLKGQEHRNLKNHSIMKMMVMILFSYLSNKRLKTSRKKFNSIQLTQPINFDLMKYNTLLHSI
jgi:hypothetical protein